MGCGGSKLSPPPGKGKRVISFVVNYNTWSALHDGLNMQDGVHSNGNLQLDKTFRFRYLSKHLGTRQNSTCILCFNVSRI